jgi:hypothetical protein
MRNSNQVHPLQSVAAALVGVFFFHAIIGVFGLRLAIAGLAAFVLGAVVVCVAFPAQGAES